MLKYEIPVSFQGTVTVLVPDNTPNPESLARHIALSRIVAVTDNEDAPDESAFEEYIEKVSLNDINKASIAWDNTVIDGVCGEWICFSNPV